MAKKYRKNFKSQLDLVCSKDDLRPVMGYIVFDKGYAVCTNAHILVKQHLSLHGFSDDEIEGMNGRALHRDVFKEIFKYDEVVFEDGHFKCSRGKLKIKVEPEVLPKYLNYEAVIPHLKDMVSVSEIGFDLSIIEVCKKVCISDENSVSMRFFGATKCTLLSSIGVGFDMETILLMPKMIN